MRLALKTFKQGRPIAHRGRRLGHSVAVHVAGDANDFAPVIRARDADALAKSVVGSLPVFAGEIFGDHYHGPLLVDVDPTDIAAGNERNADCREEVGSDEGETAK